MTAPGSSWQVMTMIDMYPGFNAIADTLADLVDEGQPVAVGVPDLMYATGMQRFRARHPDRLLQFGIAEQNMVSAAAGLATTGVVPYVVGFSAYLALLSCEQIRTDIAYTGLPVRLVGTHSGFTFGFYGSSHHATEDLAILRAIAGLSVVVPADTAALGALLRSTVSHPGPIYFRLGRGRDADVYAAGTSLEMGRAVRHGSGDDLTIVATGTMLHPSLEAARVLRADGFSVGVLDMHTVKPLDVDALLESETRCFLTVEEHSVIGGLGGAVAEALAPIAGAAPLHRHGVRDEYVIIGPPRALYAHYQLDAAGIEDAARNAMTASRARR